MFSVSSLTICDKTWDLVTYILGNRDIYSNNIIKRNIDESVYVIPILPKNVTFVKLSGENCA